MFTFPSSLRCWLAHDWMLQFSPNKLSLRCANCGRETPGWALTLPPPRPLFERPRIRSEWSTSTATLVARRS